MHRVGRDLFRSDGKQSDARPEDPARQQRGLMIAAYDFLIGPFASFGFMRTALVACFGLALASGPVGTLLLLRRMSLEGDVLSHAVMPGAAMGFLYAGYSLAALSLGGFLTGALVAGSAGLVARFRPKRPEISLAAFYLLSLALGVIIISARGSNVDLMHVLFAHAIRYEWTTRNPITSVRQGGKRKAAPGLLTVDELST